MGVEGDENLPNQPLKDVESSCVCDDKCSQEKDCEYFAYNKRSKDCWLKKNFFKKKEESGMVSGKKRVNEEESNRFLLPFFYVKSEQYSVLPWLLTLVFP